MDQQIIIIGVIILVIGLAVILTGFLGKDSGKTKVEWGFGGFIGPFPFGIASSKGMLYVLITIMMVLAVLCFLFCKF